MKENISSYNYNDTIDFAFIKNVGGISTANGLWSQLVGSFLNVASQLMPDDMNVQECDAKNDDSSTVV